MSERLTLRDIDFRVDLPKVPDTMPLAVTTTPSAKERAGALRALGEVFAVRDAIEVDLPYGYAMAGKLGQVEYFSASGAVRARDLAAYQRFPDERRDWSDVDRVDTADGVRYVLGASASKDLLARTRKLTSAMGIIGDGELRDTDIVLEQWSLLDENGEERDSGPGRATVRMSYAVAGVPLIGAGAKTNLHWDPSDTEPVLARLFHVCRPVEDVREVVTGGTERALEGLLTDPFLIERAAAGGRIAVTGITVGLLALPADIPQRFAYPAIMVDGVVEGLKDDRTGEHTLHFGQYYPAATQEALRSSGIATAA